MQIEHLAINIPDPVAFAAWYGEHLGTKVLRKLSEYPFTHFLADSTGRTILEIYHHTKAAIPEYRSMDPLVFHIAFKSQDVSRDQERLIAAGAVSAAEIMVTPAGDEMTFLRDPWGITIQLVKRKTPLL